MPRGLLTDLPKSVDIREVGPRDGLQIEAPISTAAKLEIIGALAVTGIRRVEVTSFVSPRAVPSMADAEAVCAALGQYPHVLWSALAANLRGVDRALASGIRSVEYVISAANTHNRANTRRTTAESVALVEPIAELVHLSGGMLEVILATAWDCPFEGPTNPAAVLEIAERAADAGADQLCLADTIGTVGPGRLVSLLEDVRVRVPGLDVGIHLHDTRGSGIANALSAVAAGVRMIDASVGGIGGCPFAPGASGNIATEELVYMLEDCGVETGLDLDAVLGACAIVEQALDHGLPSSLYRAGGRSRPLGERTFDHSVRGDLAEQRKG